MADKIDDDGSVGSKGSKGSKGSVGSKGSKAKSTNDDEEKKKVEFWRCATCATFNPDTVDECKGIDLISFVTHLSYLISNTK
jgi:hypothetical protein